ncbi:uncharacterized protein LOC123891979 [Trifolium pratense]|uniref:uncharacterized protein LOC123891979 n=1 Tax=Trifolium pratense TaxID=57577 RepID=UPI001E6903F4|nr:uncharacterized protein LOC123891979 [Trifolium pratense]
MAKDIAFSPCDKKSSHHSLQNRNHKVHMLLNSSSKNSQKRKFDQYINGGKFASSFELVGSENAKNQTRNSSSCLSCSTLSDGERTIWQGRQEYVSPAFCGHCTKHYSHLSGHCRDLMASNSYSYSTKEKRGKEEDIDLVDSLTHFLPSRGNHLSRLAVPIGPRFQAEVPKWEHTTNIKQYNNDDCLKWLGTQICPMSGVCKMTADGTEKGMLDSCMCCNSELVNCVEKHVGDAREIDAAFSSWKFNEIEGDDSKSWTKES